MRILTSTTGMVALLTTLFSGITAYADHGPLITVTVKNPNKVDTCSPTPGLVLYIDNAELESRDPGVKAYWTTKVIFNFGSCVPAEGMTTFTTLSDLNNWIGWGDVPLFDGFLRVSLSSQPGGLSDQNCMIGYAEMQGKQKIDWQVTVMPGTAKTYDYPYLVCTHSFPS